MTIVAELAPFQDLIHQRCGLVTEGLGEGILVAAIERRMLATGAASPQAYFSKLVGHEDEFQEFVALTTINESYFYREAEQLALLVDRLVPRMLAEPNARLPIRILSAGCATGEEPYSIAIALLERFGEAAPGLVRIVAGDIDQHALAKARLGRYTRFSFRGLPEALRGRYFHPADHEAFQLDDRVAAMVRFCHFNLLAETFPHEITDLDVVFFRNVSIYFDTQTRRVIQHGLHAAMTERGVLLTGSAETFANDMGIFRVVEEDGAFYFAKAPLKTAPKARPQPVRATPAPVLAIRRVGPVPPSAKRRRSIPVPVPVPLAASLDDLRELIRAKKYDHAGAALEARNRQPPADARWLALEGYVRMVGRDFESARSLAAKALAVDEWSADAIVLMGLVAKWRGQSGEAVRCFRQAVYGQADCWAAHYYLGEMFRAEGATAEARRSYRTALQQIKARPDPDGGLILPLDLPVAQVRVLCERYGGAPAAVRAGA